MAGTAGEPQRRGPEGERPLRRGTLILAGWLAMASAFGSIPLSWLAYRLESDPAAAGILAAIQVSGALLFVAISLLLRRLLSVRFRFCAANRSIDLMIAANLAAVALVVALPWLPGGRDGLENASLVLLVVQGVAQARLGVRLLGLPDDLDGMLRPFCYLNMVTGACIASLILVVVGLVVSAVTDLMLGTMFFYLAKPTREQHPDGTAKQG